MLPEVTKLIAEMRSCGPGRLHELVATRAEVLDWADQLESRTRRTT